ncbi:protein transport protein Sec16A isoform 2-T2 [Discoglossus pictus]
MQPPPPQTGPPTTGGPPRMAMNTNAYWRKRGPAPASVTAAPVQPVTDPFAFGRMTPQNMAAGGAPKGNMMVMPTPSPSLYQQSAAEQASPTGDYLHGMQTSGSVPQPTTKGAMYTNVSAPSTGPGYFTNSTSMSHNAEPIHSHPAVPSYQHVASGLENAFAPLPNRSQSRQGIPGDSNASSTAASLPSFVPPQQTTSHWGFVHGAPPTSGQNFPTPTPHSTYNAPYISPPYLEVSNLPPQQTSLLPNEPQHQQTPQRTAQFHYPPGSSENNVAQNSGFQTNNSHGQNPQQNNWFHQPYREQMHPTLPNSNPQQAPSQSTVPLNKTQEEYSKAPSYLPSDVDSGTISMFFKGDEAENLEILSTAHLHSSDKPEHEVSMSYQNSGHQGMGSFPQPQHIAASAQPLHSLPSAQPLHSLPSAQPLHSLPSVQPQMPVTLSSNATNTQPFLSQNYSNFPDPQAPWKNDVGDSTRAETVSVTDPQYDNVENVECIQNLEVLPSEPHNINIFPTSPDLFRYGMAPGPSLPKNINHTEGGPNLETPDALAHPIRSDSVSSSYSNLSHRSLPNSSRPQELTGTFIQKESGKLDDQSTNFFKQVDSSPIVGDISAQNTFPGSHSQPTTPSPPKPMGIFQTSANSSFEPVRSHSAIMKQVDLDKTKVIGEMQESQTVSSSAAIPAASPGNLEQPPDNLETIFTGKLNPQTGSANIFQTVGPSSFESLPLLRPSSRAHGSNKKCESPATTLWAQGELPNFGGNVLLAPAAPTLYVAPKPQTEVIQPPEDGILDTQSTRTELAKLDVSPEDQISSENLENPPKLGDEEPLHSQASSGYASLLSSPPTESLQNQPVLIAQPNKSYNLSQPINFSMTLPNQIRNINSGKDLGVAEKPVPTSVASLGNFSSEETASLTTIQTGPVLNTPASANHFSIHSVPTSGVFSDSFPNQPSNISMLNLSNQVPLNLVTDSQKSVKVEGLPSDSANKSTAPVSSPTGLNVSIGNGNAIFPPPVNSNNVMAHKNSIVGNAGALDFTVPRAPANQSTNNGMPNQGPPLAAGLGFPPQSANAPNFQPVPNNQQGFYQQVTKDVQQQASLENPQQGSSHEYLMPGSQQTPLVTSAQVATGSRPVSQHTEAPMTTTQQAVGPPYSSSSETVPKYGQPDQPTYTSAPAISAPVTMNNSTGYPEQPRPPASQTPQQGFPPSSDPYYYYRNYGAYPPPYPQPYPPVDTRASQHYYQDPYGAYDPSYRQYAKYPEPERPSSRASHSSDRPSSQQGYSSKADWSNYYPDYYQYDYGDPARWDRYPGNYDPGNRDQRSNYWGYVYGGREDPYQARVPYNYTSRYDVYADRWQYDPRYVGGFDDDEPRRDMAKDDFDRRSVHSEHSVRSLHSEHSTHSRRSSFSSHSQHSQIYNQGLTTNAYDPQLPNPNINDFSYGAYPENYSTQQALNQYTYGYNENTEWQPVEQVPSRPLTPEKFGTPHVCARFGPGGHLIKVLPNLPSDGQPTLVEIHTMEVILQNTPEQELLRAFPGPLVKDETHKVDVINFAQNKSKACSHDESLLDQESACLLWDFIVLLCRQNGTVVGTDIAELLLQDHKTVWLPGKSPNEANLIDFSNEPLEQEEESVASQLSFLADTFSTPGCNLEKETERFRELLLFGRKKDALESAMKHGLWGHALLLASKMDSRTHARVMTRFANSLPINDPLQTVYQLMSGRMPAAATCCGDEKWGDWRPHIAMVLSNLTNNLDVPSRTITTMGDTLASRGLLDAAHFCYIMAQVGFGVFTKKSTKLVLLGSNHSLPFAKFASNEAIQRTEAYEYAQSLGTQAFSLPNIQVFKFIYACRLAENGLSAQAFHYCEVIAKTVLKHSSYYSPVLISQLLEVSTHLRFFDPQLKEKPEQELFVEPPWLLRLRHLDMQIKQGTVVYNPGRSTPPQYACSTPSSELDHISQSDGVVPTQDLPPNTDNPLLANLLPNMMPPVQGVQLALPGPENTSSVYQPPVISEPYAAAPPSHIPTSGFPPPGPSTGFLPYGGDQSPTYPAPGVNALTPPPQQTEFAPQDQWNQDPAQRNPQYSPTKTFQEPGFDFYGEMARMAPGQRSRTVSQSSSHMRRTRTTSESSTHSIGSGRRSSVGMHPSPPPPAIPEVERKETKKVSKSQTHGSGRSWFPLKIGWLMGKGKNEAHLPDDRNKSIVWDENKQRWVNMDEPEEERKPPPPPPSIPQRPQNAPMGPGGPTNSSVNMFSIRAAGARGRYVDVLNPSGSKPSNAVPPPADLFAPLAPMPIPANLFVPNAVPQEEQPTEASGAETVQPSEQPGFDSTAQTQFLNSAPLPPESDLPSPNQEEDQSGELSRSSSLSSLSREVSQHFNQESNNTAPVPGPPVGAVTFYNPSKFAQPTGVARPGRLGQRKYPTLK